MNPYNIEGRPKEKPNQYVPPTRTLFVRDIAFETKIEEVEQIFKTFGEIKIAFDLIPRRGIAFITFFDLRDAERAKNTLTDLKFHGRPAEIHYSLPKEGDQSKNQASLDVEYEGPGLTEQELSDYMSKFGAVKNIKPDSSNSK